MEQETYSYVWVTSLNCGRTGVRGGSQTPQDVKGAMDRSLTDDDLKWKTTALEEEGTKEVTSLRDGSTNHLETTRPAPEEAGGPIPPDQPKERLVEGEDTQPVVFPATNPSRVVLDTALAESTAGRAERTRYGSVVHDGYFVDCSPILRRPILVAGLVHGDCGTKHQDKLGSAGDSVEPLVVQTSRINKHHIVQPLTPTSGGSARSLAGNTSLLTSNDTSSLEHVEGHPANEIRGSHEDSVRPANEEEARSRPANKEVNRS